MSEQSTEKDAHDTRGRLDRSICGLCNDAYVECSKCGVYLCECTRSEACVIPPVGCDDSPHGPDDCGHPENHWPSVIPPEVGQP